MADELYILISTFIVASPVLLLLMSNIVGIGSKNEKGAEETGQKNHLHAVCPSTV